MTPDPLLGLLTIALIDAVILYAVVVSRRVHERRLRERLSQTAHLAAVVRAGRATQHSTG